MHVFSRFRDGSDEDLFLELCFCLLTANFQSEKSMVIHESIGRGFVTHSERTLSKRLRSRRSMSPPRYGVRSHISRASSKPSKMPSLDSNPGSVHRPPLHPIHKGCCAASAMLLPVSLLSSYLYCPRKVFLQRVLSMREPPRPELFVGSLRHAVFDRFSEHERSVLIRFGRGVRRAQIESSILDAYDSIIREELRVRADALYSFALDPEEVYAACRASCEADARLRAQLISTFLETSDVEHERLYEELRPRIVSEQSYVDESIGITGVIDRILLYDDEAVPFEFKTGSTPRTGMWQGHRIQLSAYLVLLSSSYPVSHGVVRYLDSDTDVELKLTPFIRHELVTLVREIRALLERTTVPRRVDQITKCARCGLRDACYSESTVTDALITRFGSDVVLR